MVEGEEGWGGQECRWPKEVGNSKGRKREGGGGWGVGGGGEWVMGTEGGT